MVRFFFLKVIFFKDSENKSIETSKLRNHRDIMIMLSDSKIKKKWEKNNLKNIKGRKFIFCLNQEIYWPNYFASKLEIFD